MDPYETEEYKSAMVADETEQDRQERALLALLGLSSTPRTILKALQGGMHTRKEIDDLFSWPADPVVIDASLQFLGDEGLLEPVFGGTQLSPMGHRIASLS